MKKHLKIFSLILSSAFVLAGCDDFEPNWPNDMALPDVSTLDIDTPWKDYSVPCASITLGKGENAVNLNKGETFEYSYTVEPRNATLSSLVWESDNPGVATVSNGVLTAVSGGSANITVTSGDAIARSRVKVTVPITDFEVTNKNLSLDLNGQVQIESVFTPADTTQNKLSYEVVGGVVSVSDTGLISASEATGDVTINVTNEFLNKVEVVNVSVSDQWKYVNDLVLSLNGGGSDVEVTKSGTINCEVVPADASTLAKYNKVEFKEKKANEEDPSYLNINKDTGEFTVLEKPTSNKVSVIASLYDERANNTVEKEFELNIFEVTATAISLGGDSHATIELDNDESSATKPSSYQLNYAYTLSEPSYEAPSRGHIVYSTSDNSVAKVSSTGLVELVGINPTNGNATARITVTDTNYNVSDYVDVHNTIYAKSVAISKSGEFYLDESIEISASVTPANTSDSLVWDYDNTLGHTFVEDGNKLTITCNNLDDEVVVKAHVGLAESNEITLTPKEREIDFEYGKTYIVGNRNYKTGESKPTADGLGSWSRAKYAYVMTDKTGNANALYEYKSTLTFEEGDTWKIRENVSDWRDVEGYAGEDELRHKIGYYKVTEGAFATGQMGVTNDDDKNIVVNEAGTYDIYYAFYMNESTPAEGWYEVFVEEHGMKLSSSSVHAKLGTESSIVASNWDGTLLVEDVDSAFIEVDLNATTGVITITPVATGNTSFKVKDDVKEITVSVEIKEGSSAAVTEYYIRGTAANDWSTLSADYVLRASADANNRGEILDVYLKEGSFKIAKADWSESWGYKYKNDDEEQEHVTIIGSAASKFGPDESSSDNNIKCLVAGYYNIYLTVNNYISIVSVGGDDPIIQQSPYYVRGTAVGSWDALEANKMDLDDGNKAVIHGISLTSGGEFKIASADWSQVWGYYYDDRATVIGGAAGYFEEAESDQNIKCKLSGKYDIYLTNENYISIEFAAFNITSTSGTIEAGESYVVNALHLNGTFSYDVTVGDATVTIDGAQATITSNTVGEATILFSDDSSDEPVTFTLSVVAAVAKNRQYIETKSWFNSGASNEQVFVYAYKDGSDPMEENASFPGEEASWVKDLADGKKLFYFDIPETYDSFIVTKVVDGAPTYQTVDVSIASLSGDNCIYLGDQPENTGIKVEVGHYSFALGLTSDSATITSGGSAHVTIENSIGDVSYVVTPADSATVVIENNVATISSEVVGTSTITFSDESLSSPVSFTLTVEESGVKTRQYIETKSWFNSGAANEHVYVYAFKAGSSPMVENASFPGEEATYVKDLADSKKLFYFDISETFDSFIVSKVEGETKTYQTVDITISELGGENCIYLGNQPENVETKVEIGHYDYVLGLSESSGTISSGNSTSVTIQNYLGELSYEVSPEGSATVNIVDGVATISSSTVGTTNITFSDESSSSAVVYTLTVTAPVETRTQYIETKGWFNSGASNEHVYVYAFKKGSSPMQDNATFPGEEATWVKDLSDGKKIFVFEIPTIYDTFIVSKVVDGEGKTSQTVDISITDLGTNNCIYLVSDTFVADNAAIGCYPYIPS